MKKKFRPITIDGANWAWSFKTSDNEYGTQTLKIWLDKKIIFDKSYNYNREKKSYEIKPSLIARFIKTHLM